MNSSEFYVDPWFVITKQSIKKTKYPILLLRGIKLGISLIKHWLSMFIAERQALEPTLSENIIKSQIADNHTLSTIRSKSKFF